MHVCFVEYRIEPEFEREYRAWIRGRQAEEGFLLYEGTDQPGLFVEIWEAADKAGAEAIKKERCDERSSWTVMRDWLPRGKQPHAWVFRRVRNN